MELSTWMLDPLVGPYAPHQCQTHSPLVKDYFPTNQKVQNPQSPVSLMSIKLDVAELNQSWLLVVLGRGLHLFLCCSLLPGREDM